MPSVTRSAQPSRQDRRAALERQLLEATERLMGEGLTFTELSVDRLATTAGVSRATFYVYFQDKGHLLRQLAQQVLTDISDAAGSWWDVAERRDPEDLRHAIRTIIAVYRRHQAVLAAIVETSTYDAEVAAEYRGLIDGIKDATKEIIERGQADGAIRAMPSEQTAGALTWMVERVCIQMVHRADPGDDDKYADALTEVVWGALYLKPARG